MGGSIPNSARNTKAVWGEEVRVAENATAREVDGQCQQASEAFTALSKMPPDGRAGVLEAIAAALDAKQDTILRTCAEETALTIDELTPEFARMTGTLRMFAGVVREGSWVRAAIDTPSQQSLGPSHDVRRMLVPLGPVAVFGSSNFPLAYGVCGGDTASALAAGCPVVVKEHPAHPRTGRMIAEIAQEAIRAAGFLGDLLGYLHNENPKDFSVARELVQHPRTAAVGFTGSIAGGLAIENLARDRKSRDRASWNDSDPGKHDRIPVYAEMGSMNAVVVLRHAARNRLEQIADDIAASVLARHGQQCTKPGMVIIGGYEEAERFYAALCARFSAAMPRRMLAPWIADTFRSRLAEIVDTGIVEARSDHQLPVLSDADLVRPVALFLQAVSAEDEPDVWEELFGPAVIVCAAGHLAMGWPFIPNALTATLVADPKDFLDADEDALDDAWLGESSRILYSLGQRAGRIIFNGVPTGVRVAHGMVHGGPFPATNRPDTTAVGPCAIERWCRPVCFQNCPDGLLPAELRNGNPRGIWRTLNGTRCKASVA
jgi:NADP-dependent aldehyde dehydrogenase